MPPTIYLVGIQYWNIRKNWYNDFVTERWTLASILHESEAPDAFTKSATIRVPNPAESSDGTQVTDEGVEKLWQALPKCEIPADRCR